MQSGEKKKILIQGVYFENLFIIASGLVCGIVFNHICHNSYLNLQGILGGTISTILIIWLNPED
ncbi:MAG TPA: hypothetical protein PKG60_01580 [Spirochaetota bacterium]|nr:hypothetical protein [Spirochaetota bacterium]HPS85851.1 hypothetical protein [Spirochaetota bacterium]